MGQTGRFILGLLFLVLVVEIVIIAPRSIRDSVELPPPSNPKPTHPVEQVMQEAHLVETRDGGKEWELWAGEAIRYKLKDNLALNRVKVVFFGKGGIFFTVTGDRGNVEVQTKNMRIDGNVVTRSSNGYRFRTDSAIYNSEQRMLRSPSQVKMDGPKDKHGEAIRLTGRSMEAEMNTSVIRIIGNVRAEKTIEQDKPVHIRSRRAVLSSKTNLARFEGDVVMDMKSMRVTGPEAEFEYDPSSEAVKSLLVSGGVRMSDIDKWATSDRVRADFLANRMVLQGNPRVVQNSDELVGDEIVLLDGGKKVKVENARARVDKKRLEKVN